VPTAHGRANAPAGAVRTVDSRYIRSFFGERRKRDRFGTPGPVTALALATDVVPDEYRRDLPCKEYLRQAW
jgi:hypothetical protein